MSKHTPEPWDGGVIVRAVEYDVRKPDWFARAAVDIGRAVYCVNALAGIADPEAWVKAVRELLEGLNDPGEFIADWSMVVHLKRIRAAETGKEPG